MLFPKLPIFQVDIFTPMSLKVTYPFRIFLKKSKQSKIFCLIFITQFVDSTQSQQQPSKILEESLDFEKFVWFLIFGPVYAVVLLLPSSVVDGGRRDDVASEEDREEGERVLSSFHAVVEPASFWLQELSVAIE